MLFSGLSNISLQILRNVGRVWNERSRISEATIAIDYYKAFGLTKSPLFGAVCIDQASSYLEVAEQAQLRAFTKQRSPAMGNIIDPKPLTSCILP